MMNMINEHRKKWEMISNKLHQIPDYQEEIAYSLNLADDLFQQSKELYKQMVKERDDVILETTLYVIEKKLETSNKEYMNVLDILTKKL